MLHGTGRIVTANFFTPGYRIVGKVAIGAAGMMGLLTNPATSFIDLNDVKMARLYKPGVLADKRDFLQLVKFGLVLIGMERVEDAGPLSSSRSSYGKPKNYQIRFITASYEIEGTLERTGRLDMKSFLADGAGDFVIMRDANVRAIQYPDMQLKSPAVIVNRRKVDTVALLNMDDLGA